MSVITGSKEVFPQPTSYGQNDAGSFSIIPFESTDPNKINALAAQFQALGYNYNVEHSFGKSKITLQLAFNPLAIEAPVDLWEYIGQDAQKDLLCSAVQTGITATLSQQNIEIIRQCLANDFSSTASKDASVKTLAQSDFTDGNPANAFKIYNLMKAGVTDSLVQTSTIRHTQTVSYVYPLTLSKLNLNRIISTPTLIAMENPPNWAVTGLPSDIPPGFQTIQAQFAWRKKSPTIQQIAFRKEQLIQEFEYGLWATDVWGLPL